MVFVDTGAWFARFVPSDPQHKLVKTWFDANREPLLTTDYCIDEALTLLAARGRILRAMEAGRAIFEERITQIHYVSRDEFARAWILFRQRAISGWSFTDCTSKVAIDALNLPRAVSLDDHFRQFGIEVLP